MWEQFAASAITDLLDRHQYAAIPESRDRIRINCMDSTRMAVSSRWKSG